MDFLKSLATKGSAVKVFFLFFFLYSFYLLLFFSIKEASKDNLKVIEVWYVTMPRRNLSEANEENESGYFQCSHHFPDYSLVVIPFYVERSALWNHARFLSYDLSALRERERERKSKLLFLSLPSFFQPRGLRTRSVSSKRSIATTPRSSIWWIIAGRIVRHNSTSPSDNAMLV